MELEGSIQKWGQTAAEWTSQNPVLKLNQEGFETDTKKSKHGDGVTDWNSLGYSHDSIEFSNITGDAEDNTSLVSYVQTELNTVIRDQGNYDASSNLFPTTGGSGTGGAIERGNQFTISVSGTLGGTAVTSPYSIIRALVDTPGQTAGNWFVENRTTPVSSTSYYDIIGTRYSGKYYTIPYTGVIGSGTGWTGGIYVYPVPIGEAHSITALRFRVVSGIASSNARIVLYASNSVGYPSTVLLDTGDISTATNGDKIFLFTSAISLTGKFFYVGFQVSANISVMITSSPVIILQRAANQLTAPMNYFTAQAYGTPPNPYTAGQSLFQSGIPIVDFLRV